MDIWTIECFTAGLDGRGWSISILPSHLEANIQLFGLLQLHAFGAGVDINLDAQVQGRGPLPWEVDALIRGALKVNLLLKTKEFSFEAPFHWEEPLIPYPADPILSMDVEHLKTDQSWAIALQKRSQAEDNLPLPNEMPSLSEIPPDARPVITFTRPIHNDIMVGMANGADAASVNPSSEVIRQGWYEFSYHLEQLELFKAKASVNSWEAIAAFSVHNKHLHQI